MSLNNSRSELYNIYMVNQNFYLDMFSGLILLLLLFSRDLGFINETSFDFNVR